MPSGLVIFGLISPATVSHRFSKLSSAGLLRSEKGQSYQTFSLADDLWGRTMGELIWMPQSGLTAQVEENAYRQKVLATFLRQGPLIGIPAQPKKRQIILEKLAQEFEPDRTYTEREVNQIVVGFHDDVATLRRGMVEHGLMQRVSGGYWRVPRT